MVVLYRVQHSVSYGYWTTQCLLLSIMFEIKWKHRQEKHQYVGEVFSYLCFQGRKLFLKGGVMSGLWSYGSHNHSVKGRGLESRSVKDTSGVQGLIMSTAWSRCKCIQASSTLKYDGRSGQEVWTRATILVSNPMRSPKCYYVGWEVNMASSSSSSRELAAQAMAALPWHGSLRLYICGKAPHTFKPDRSKAGSFQKQMRSGQAFSGSKEA